MSNFDLLNLRKYYLSGCLINSLIIPHEGKLLKELSKLKNEGFCIDEKNELQFEKFCKSNNIEDLFFICHLLAVFDDLDIKYLRIILHNFKYYIILQRNLLFNLNRIYSFQIVNDEIINMFLDFNESLIEKYYILNLMINNGYEGSYKIQNGSIQAINIIKFELINEKYKSKIVNIEDREKFIKSLEVSIARKYKVILEDYIASELPVEIKGLMELLFPRDKELIDEKMIPLYELALEKRSKLNNCNF